MFGDVFSVEFENGPFYSVDFPEVMCLDVGGNGLGQASDQHVFPKQSHCFAVEQVGEWLALVK